METETKSPLRTILGWTLTVFTLIFVAYIALKFFLLQHLSDTTDSQSLSTIAASLEIAAAEFWKFISPLLQLSIVLVIVEWVLSKLGVKLIPHAQQMSWNVQTVIALVIICTFAIASLADIKGAVYLKDMALVVVGFYFGSKRQESNHF